VNCPTLSSFIPTTKPTGKVGRLGWVNTGMMDKNGNEVYKQYFEPSDKNGTPLTSYQFP
jgi:hypothetical protein